MSKVFIDTHILVYTLDKHIPKRQGKSRALLRRISEEGTGVISTQVLQEFYVVVTRKLGIEPIEAKGILHAFENFEVVTVTASLIKEAVDCSILNQLSFWDALIVVSAESARCEKIWTEDLNAGQIVNGLLIENPFLKT